MACGFAGMQLTEFWKARPAHIFAIILGKHRELELEKRTILEGIRWALFRYFNFNLKVSQRYKKVTDVAQFYWEIEAIKQFEKRKAITDKQYAQRILADAQKLGANLQKQRRGNS